MDCILTNGYKIPHHIKLATIILIRSMAQEHPMVFREVVEYFRNDDPQAPLSNTAIKFMRLRGTVPPGKNRPSEDVRQMFRLAVQDDPQQKGQFLIADPEVHYPWSPKKT